LWPPDNLACAGGRSGTLQQWLDTPTSSLPAPEGYTYWGLCIDGRMYTPSSPPLSPPAAPAPYPSLDASYYQATGGSCGTFITTFADCQLAASTLGVSYSNPGYTIDGVSDQTGYAVSYYPPGCVLLTTPDYINLNLYNSANTGQCGSTWQCLCMAAPPPSTLSPPRPRPVVQPPAHTHPPSSWSPTHPSYIMEPEAKDAPIGTIIGGVTGGVVVLGLALAGLFVAWKRRALCKSSQQAKASRWGDSNATSAGTASAETDVPNYPTGTMPVVSGTGSGMSAEVDASNPLPAYSYPACSYPAEWSASTSAKGMHGAAPVLEVTAPLPTYSYPAAKGAAHVAAPFVEATVVSDSCSGAEGHAGAGTDLVPMGLAAAYTMSNRRADSVALNSTADGTMDRCIMPMELSVTRTDSVTRMDPASQSHI